MPDLQFDMNNFSDKQLALYESVLNGKENPPPCYTCGAISTHVSKRLTPAGYHAWQCCAHARSHPVWGSDPGWEETYVPIADMIVKKEM